VDVGVVTWNTRDLTVKALRHLLDGDQGAQLRLLVRDNGSSDGTPQAIAAEVPEAFLEAGTDNLGFAQGVNRLLARSDAPWFFALNSDAWPMPGTIGRLVRAAEEHPRAAAIAPKLVRPDGSIEHSTQAFPTIGTALRFAVPGYARWRATRAYELMFPGAWQHDRPREVDWAVGAALLIRRTALDDLGPLDDRLFMYAEDLEWCWRAARAGWTIWFEPSAVVTHVGGVSAAQNFGPRRVRAYWRNTYRVYRWSHSPVSTLVFRLVNMLWAVMGLLRSLTRRRAAARFWLDQLRAHFVSARGPDRAP
jgi:GT2 family glycosyltransferase